MLVNSINSATDYPAVSSQTTDKKSEPKKVQSIGISTDVEQQTDDEMSKLQSVLAENNISLDFSRDEQTRQIVVRLVDSETGEAVRQFPTEVSLKLSAVYAKLQGQFVNKQG